MNGREKFVEFRLIDDEEMPPMVIKQSEEGYKPVVIINQAHNVWLALQRSSIPGICQSLADKLNAMCDAHLEEQLMNEEMA
jgi:hypothetical protein|tara:strand:+ start:6750 stop:6992 length:243 start_codon:yes stop_codon:yes gene_type:complete